MPVIRQQFALDVRVWGARTEIHDVVTADGAVINDDVPGPEGYGVPLYAVSPHLMRVS
jgi:hypothetical protein